MASPYKPSTKQTLLPNSNIQELLPETHSIPSSDENEDVFEAKYYHQQHHNQHHTNLSRLPTLYEVLNRKTQPPVDLWSFYIFMRDYQNSVDYLDFWIDVITHLRLCKDYVKGLRESLLLSEKHKSSSGDDKKRNTTSSSNFNFSPDQDESQRNSGVTAAQFQRSSVSSSLLLEALLNEGFLDDNDNKRVSSFLQGNEYINTSDPRINAILGVYTTPAEEAQGTEPEIEEAPLQEPSTPNPNTNQYEPLTSPSKSYARGSPKIGSNKHSGVKEERNSTRILPEQLEKYTSNIKNGNITRTTLKSSSKNLLNTYFQDGSSHKLSIPDRIIRKIKHDVELQGRDDPEVFEEAKNHVYGIMERDFFPIFLQQNALHNLNNNSCLIRLITGLFLLFAGLWISYCLIFIDIKPKAIRAVIIVPFVIGTYLILTFLYKLDPLLVWLGLSDDQELYTPRSTGRKRKLWVKNLEEPFIKNLLRKRSLWILFLVLIISAVLSIVFGLVPGHRL